MLHKVSVVKVTDPKTGKSLTLSYDESSQIILINQDGMHFESEAYHLYTWCREMGYELIIKDFALEV